MKTEQALRDFIASRVAANLRPSTIQWYKDRLLPFSRCCPTLPRRPEPVEYFMSTIGGSPETRYNVYRALKTFFKFICSQRLVLPEPEERGKVIYGLLAKLMEIGRTLRISSL